MQQCQWCLSTVLVCTALHLQITRWHCSKFSSVAPLSIWTSQTASQTAVIQSVHRSFLIHTGALASCQAATLSQYAESVYTMCLRIHLPVFVDNPHGRQRVAPVCSVMVSRVHECMQLHVSTSIYRNTRSISRISGTRVRLRGYTIIPRAGAWRTRNC